MATMRVLRLGKYLVTFIRDTTEVYCNGVTYCRLYQGNKLLRVGTAVCSRDDKFENARGDKQAFTRAIASFDKATRTDLWKSYWGK